MSNPSAAFLGGINKTVDAYQNNPQALQQEIQQDAKKPLIQQKLQKLIALEMISKDYKAAENQVKALSNPFTNTVFERKAQEVVGLKEADVANRIAAVEQTKAAEQRKRLQQLAGQGLPAVKTAKAGGSVNKLNMGGLVGEYVRNPTMKAANGGLVSFKEGGKTVGDALYELGADAVQEVKDFANEYPWATAAISMVPIVKGTKIIGHLTKAGFDAYKKIKLLKKYRKNPTGKEFNKWKKENPELAQKIKEGNPNIIKEHLNNNWEKYLYGSAAAPAVVEGGAAVLDTPLDTFSSEEKKEEVVVDPLQTENERLLALIAEMQAGQTPTVNKDRAAIEDAYDETAGAYETGMGSLNTSLQAATDRQKTDDAARATLQSNLTQEMGAQTEAYERGIGTVKSAQGTAFGEHQNAINQLEGMAKKARGTDRDYLRDLISGLSAVGQGSNLGQGLGIAGQTIVGRQDERDATARGIEKEALGEKVRLSESKLAGAKDIVGLENKLADSKVANQRLLNAEDAETRQLGTANQGLINTITATIADYGVRAKEAVLGKVLALAEQSVREMTIAAQQKQLTTQDIANLTKLSASLADTLGNIPMLEGLDEDEKANAQRKLLERIQSIQGAVESLIGIAGI